MRQTSIRHNVGIGPDDLEAPAGFAPDVRVTSVDGLVPAGKLSPGDWLVTARGTKRLLRITRQSLSPPLAMVRVAKELLKGRSGEDIVVSPTQRVVLRDWRARAIWGRHVAAPIIADIVDEEFVTVDRTIATEIVSLYVGQPEILVVQGFEFASADGSMLIAPSLGHRRVFAFSEASRKPAVE